MQKVIYFNRQRGSVLTISLLILVVLILIGVTNMGTTALEEKMSGNLRDQNLSFQASEGAVRAGEDWLSKQAAIPDKVSTCATPPCDVWDANATDIAGMANQSYTWWEANAKEFGVTGTQEFTDLNGDPYYMVEELYASSPGLNIGTGNTTSRRLVYRVTTAGVGASDSTQSVLASTYAKEWYGH